MGIGMSKEEWKKEEKERVDDFVKDIREGPNLRVNDGIKNFTGLDSSENLRKHYKKRKMEAGVRAAVLMKNLVEKLGAFTPAPKLVGLGALAIAIFIDIKSSGSSSTEDALRSVFAQEKISKVWNHIDECLKRYRMNINNEDELMTDMRRIECELSEALTTLKNSMLELHGENMSSEALKAWVNGAAFHIQLRIHVVRLGWIQTCDPIKELISIYKNDLDDLFKKHKEVIKEKCYTTTILYDEDCTLEYLVGEDKEEYMMHPLGRYSTHLEGYYNHRYGRQKRDIHQYFSDVGQNLQELIDQRGSFNIN